MSYERSSITELATELGVLPDRIYSWRKEFADYGSASFLGHGVERLSDEGRRVKELEEKLKTTELELEILKNVRRFLKDRQVMYAFIDCNRGRYTVEMMAKGRYGAPRIAAEIQAKHQYMSVNTVSKYMKRIEFRSKLSRKYR